MELIGPIVLPSHVFADARTHVSPNDFLQCQRRQQKKKKPKHKQTEWGREQVASHRQTVHVPVSALTAVPPEVANATRISYSEVHGVDGLGGPKLGCLRVRWVGSSGCGRVLSPPILPLQRPSPG